MAVTPAGNPYVESSDLVANYPGASEALAERIDIVGVNPFADSAARATAIPSPVEGQMASLNDDNQVYRYSGSAWVAVGLPPGLNPVAPTSIANSGGSASTTGNTTTFTNVSALSLNGCFSSTYDNYRIMVDFSAASGSGVFPSLRLRVSGTDATTGYEQSLFLSAAAAHSYVNPDGTTLWSVGYFSTGDVNEASCNAEIYKPFLARITSSQVNLFQATGNLAGFSYGYHNAATSYDGLTLLISSGTISGKIRVYGYKD